MVTTTNHLPFDHYEPTSLNTCVDIFRRGGMGSGGNDFFLIKYLNVEASVAAAERL